jgi:hypothetical protein
MGSLALTPSPPLAAFVLHGHRIFDAQLWRAGQDETANTYVIEISV